jgi:hypothetical protein
MKFSKWYFFLASQVQAQWCVQKSDCLTEDRATSGWQAWMWLLEAEDVGLGAWIAGFSALSALPSQCVDFANSLPKLGMPECGDT